MKNRIPAADVEGFSPWQLPDLDGEQLIYIADNEQARTLDLPIFQEHKEPVLNLALTTNIATKDCIKEGSDHEETIIDSTNPAEIADDEQLLTTGQNKAGNLVTNRVRLTGSELEALILESREQAYQKGFQQGLDDGVSEGLKRGEVQGREQSSVALKSALSSLASLEAQLPTALQLHNREELNFILDLTEKITRVVLARELQNSANIRVIVEQALQSLNLQDHALRVVVAPIDAITLKDYAQGKPWGLVADEALQAGDCRIESAHANLDHTVENRLMEAIASLRDKLSSVDDSAGATSLDNAMES